MCQFDCPVNHTHTLLIISTHQVLFLIDISCSMAGSFEELRAALIDFIKNRPHTLK